MNKLKNVAAEVFSFGTPESIERVSLLQLLEAGASLGAPFYTPPVSFELLTRAYTASPYHSSPIQTKRNILASLFVPNQYLSAADFRAAVLDDLVFGNAYFERVRGRLGTWSLKHCPAKYVRRGTDLNQYYFLQSQSAQGQMSAVHEFKRGSICHIMQTDFNQEIYGVPEYLGALASAWLNEAATLFRRRFYANGAHAGSIIYVSESEGSDKAVANVKDQLKAAKNGGNFKNLFVHFPNGKKDGIQVIPLSEATGKDEFFNVKNVSRDDLLAAHRVPPALMSIIPTNTAGFGDVTKSAEVFYMNELAPLMARWQEVNDWAGEQVIAFKPFALPSDSKA